MFNDLKWNYMESSNCITLSKITLMFITSKGRCLHSFERRHNAVICICEIQLYYNTTFDKYQLRVRRGQRTTRPSGVTKGSNVVLACHRVSKPFRGSEILLVRAWLAIAGHGGDWVTMTYSNQEIRSHCPL